MNGPATATPKRVPRARIDWGRVRVLFGREMRTALRDRNVVINSILIPLLLYPLILWLAFTAITFIQGRNENLPSRVLVSSPPAEHPELLAAIEADDRILPARPPPDGQADTDAADPARQIKDGQLDAWVEFTRAGDDAAALAGNFSVRITFDKSKDRSVMARDRIAGHIDSYRTEWLEREGRDRGVTPAEWEVFTLTMENTASNRQMGRFILGRTLPLFFVIMVALGCFHPAVDSTAGERERGTWETLLSTAAGRTEIAIAKYLYVSAMGGIAGILNLAALAATLKPIFAPLMEKSGDALSFSVPLAALPVIALAAVLLSGFVAAGMMVFAAFARTYKEGQSMITPFFMVVMIPVLFMLDPTLRFSNTLACVPLVNVVLMVRSALEGSLPLVPILLTVVSSLACIALLVRLGAFVLRSEAVVVGSHQGGLRTHLQHIIFRRRARARGNEA